LRRERPTIEVVVNARYFATDTYARLQTKSDVDEYTASDRKRTLQNAIVDEFDTATRILFVDDKAELLPFMREARTPSDERLDGLHCLPNLGMQLQLNHMGFKSFEDGASWSVTDMR